MRAQDCTRDICRNRFSDNARTPNCLHNICLYLYLRMYFRLCLHVDTSSFRLFKFARCGFVTIRCFSALHKPHRLVVLEYGFPLARILHVIVKALFFACSALIYIYIYQLQFANICILVTRVSRANSASLPPRRITYGCTVQASAKCNCR